MCDCECSDEVWSCQFNDARLSLRVEAGSATIGYYKNTACESVHINIESEELELSIHMYANSQSVQVMHVEQEEFQFVCSVLDIMRFIMFPFAAGLTFSQLLRLARSVYSPDVLPCNGTEVMCDGNTAIAACEMECSEVEENLKALAQLEEEDAGEWVDISLLFAFQLHCSVTF